MATVSSGWLPPEPEPPKEEVDWDLYLGPAAWRPFNKALLDGFNFEKGGGLVGGGVLEWGSHCVDLCQWANNCRQHRTRGIQSAGERRAGRPLRRWRRTDSPRERLDAAGVLPRAVRRATRAGSKRATAASSYSAPLPCWLAAKSRRSAAIPATFHVRDFLDCVKSRGKPLANADVACYSHITCHAANIAVFLGRKLTYDPQKNEFVGDEQANRLAFGSAARTVEHLTCWSARQRRIGRGTELSVGR